MKTTRTLRLALALALVSSFILLPSSLLRAQGSLTPPPGAPAPTMRTLQELYDRIQAQETAIAARQAQLAAALAQKVTYSYITGSLPWKISIVDGLTDSTGQLGTLAFGPDGQPAIAYHSGNGTAPKFARFNGSTWTVTTVDSASAVSDYTSLAFGPDGQPAIACYTGFAGGLKLARFNGTSWTLTTVDGASEVGRDNSLAFGPDGHPAISYYDVPAGNLKFARFNGTWTLTSLDSGQPASALVGFFTSLAFGPDGQPAISYFDTTADDLKFARFNGTTWSVSTLDSGGTVGEYTSLAFGPDGLPAISYYDSTNGNLKFARMGTFPPAP